MRWIVMSMCAYACACVSSGDVECPNGGICPADTACREVELWSPDPAAVETEFRCVLPADIAACVELGENDPCEAVAGPGQCHSGVCVLVSCGNHLLDLGEVCDDGNELPGDGCSFACGSDETCGNGSVDPVVVVGENAGIPEYGEHEQCDGGNAAPHDGCSATCKRERPRWIEGQVLAQIPGRAETAMVYDTRREQLVLFGGALPDIDGVGFIDEHDDTWIGRVLDCATRNCVTWRLLPLVSRPPARHSHAMSFDHERGRVVMFGGEVLFQLDDLWEFDGRSWTEVFPITKPNRRRDAAMVYDPRRKVSVLFGGFTSGLGPVADRVLDDTWEWNGSEWREVVTAIKPPAQEGHAMTYDPVHGVIVLVGQRAGITETWTYDGTWTPAVSGGPPVRTGAAMTFDVESQRVLLYGGVPPGGTPIHKDVWAWDGASWTEVGLGAERHGFAMATDVDRRVSVVVGGESATDTQVWNGSGFDVTRSNIEPPAERAVAAYDSTRDRVVLLTADSGTWELVRGHWVQVDPGNTGPQLVTDDFAMTYDAGRQRTLLVARNPGLELWSWNGTTWTAEKAPPAIGCALAYDAEHDRTLMFGACRGTLVNNQTFELRGDTWTELFPATRPNERFGHTLVFDDRRGELVMFGGTRAGQQLSDTWVFVDDNWVERTPARRPPPRAGHGAAWNPARGTMVVFGGHAGFSFNQDTWEWDGSEWTEIPIDLAPESRDVFAMTSTRSGVLLFGGVTGPIASPLNTLRDTWDFQFEPLEEVDQCGPRDGDLDGLVGCADPDCAVRCAPGCAPGPGGSTDGVANVTCLFDVGPRCGNDIADGTETCQTCPGDFLPAACVADQICGDLVCESDESTSCPGDCPI